MAIWHFYKFLQKITTTTTTTTRTTTTTTTTTFKLLDCDARSEKGEKIDDVWFSRGENPFHPKAFLLKELCRKECDHD